jgi:hypothetical protein
MKVFNRDGAAKENLTQIHKLCSGQPIAAIATRDVTTRSQQVAKVTRRGLVAMRSVIRSPSLLANGRSVLTGTPIGMSNGARRSRGQFSGSKKVVGSGGDGTKGGGRGDLP